ncbi:putative HTH-type transcriptional regulator [Mycobacteroides abscessus subsp. abscessus]|nr:putative HTH-type transcriptional regulator [Mycobacteroides abscessus subsp. abscessus]
MPGRPGTAQGYYQIGGAGAVAVLPHRRRAEPHRANPREQPRITAAANWPREGAIHTATFLRYPANLLSGPSTVGRGKSDATGARRGLHMRHAGVGHEARTTSTQGPSHSPKRERRRRGSITAEDIIAGAFELAEEIGISGLSMPLLAKHLDVGVTSIYWYFRKKGELLDAMTDRATKQYHFAAPFLGDETWQDALRSHTHRMREAFRERPVLVELILMRTSELSSEALQASIQNLESLVRTLIGVGFSPDNALDVYFALSLHIRGVVVLEHMDTVMPASGEARSLVPSATLAPTLHELASRGHSIATISDANFDFTVEAIIERAENLLAQDIAAREAS